MTDHTNLIARLRELLSYDEVTGQVFWRKSYGKVVAGRRAGWDRKDGYREIKVMNKQYKEHRVIWMLVHGVNHDGEIDHIDGNPSNNKLSNLRATDHFGNMQNVRMKLSGSKLMGAFFHRETGKWQASINVRRKQIYIGLYKTMEEAHEAYVQAKRIYHPLGTL